jgi:hypothetical protein
VTIRFEVGILPADSLDGFADSAFLLLYALSMTPIYHRKTSAIAKALQVRSGVVIQSGFGDRMIGEGGRAYRSAAAGRAYSVDNRLRM